MIKGIAEKEKKLEKKRYHEYKTVIFMIQFYCHGKHKTKKAMKGIEYLCEDCKSLALYVKQRIEKCPFMETKTFCAMCKVHCYKADERKKIKAVMRFSGPKMLIYHPILTSKHLYLTIKEAKTLKKHSIQKEIYNV